MANRLIDTLQISDLTLQIEGPAVWIEALGQMWQGWMGGVPADPWTLSLTTRPADPTAGPLFAVRPRFTNGICQLSAPGFSGWIDPDQAAAGLEAHPDADIGDLSIFVRTCLALQAFERGALLFHAAGVVRQGQGYALFGLSGSGKTTAARFSRDAVVLNDDLILIRQGTAGWELWATPFGGSWRPNCQSAPLRALLRLVQAEQDRLETMRPAAALGEVVSNSPVINADGARLPVLLSRWQKALEEIPVRALYFRKGPAFWEVLDVEFR
jgi:hypothetical protein